jgi:hypothetical protein
MEHANILRTELVPISSITPHPANARQANASIVEGSLRDFGQYVPVLVQESTGYILKGNNTHRIMAEKLGKEHIQATFVSCSDRLARAILAVDNRSTDGAGYDETRLLALLEELEDDGTLSAAGFDETDIGDLLSRLEDDEDPVPEDPDPLDHTPPPPAPPPEVHDSASVKDSGPSLADESKAYEENRTRVIMLNYAMPIYTYVFDQLEKLARKSGALPADVVLDLIERQTGVPAPVIE